MTKLTDEEFLRRLSDDEWVDAEAVAGLANILCKDLTKETEFRFVRAAMEKMRANPPSNALEMLNAGLVSLGKPPLTATRKRRGKLS